MTPDAKNERTESPRIAAGRSIGPLPFTETQRFSRSAARALYDRELAFYLADAPFLTVEKCAERCAKLSLLLTQAHVG
jgi:hypothetical protein